MPHRNIKGPGEPPPNPRQQWLFRVAALLVVPIGTLAVVEFCLRLAGYGYPTTLFEKVRLNGRDYMVNNEKFSLRFFPPELARWVNPLKFEAVKPPDTCRIFIFGESAAQGDPEPSYGAGRYLEVLLRERYPGVHFEVLNVAITAINSHVVLPIARECAQYEGDLWIIYMGNNEMIGPFGVATVFGAKAPPWPLVRISLVLQTTRTGQLLMDLARRVKGRASEPAVWGGLQMFLGNEVVPDDPRKEVVYTNFERNLRDILHAGVKSGARVLLNTVAVNLKDCPPFASSISRRLNSSELEECNRLSLAGKQSEASGDWKTATEEFGKALALDPQFAENHFREGQCLLRLNDPSGARIHFQQACDDDALPFRTDSPLNDIIRKTAEQFNGPEFVLCDAAASLADPGEVSGQKIFYEHVHFNFDGNYRLARLWAEKAGPLLPAFVNQKGTGRWASQEVCEARLGLTDWNRQLVLKEVRDRRERPPLNNQLDNQKRVADLSAQIDRLAAGMDAAAAAKARALYVDAINRAPDDYLLRQNYGQFLQLTGDLRGAAMEWQKAAELMPRNPFACLTEGQILASLGEISRARKSMERALELHPRYAEAWFDLGKLAAAEGKLDDAITEYRRAAALQPYNADIYLFMGKAFSLLKKPDDSVQNFRHALQLDSANWEAHYDLGGELGVCGDFADAKAEFQKVVRLRPQFSMGHLNLGVALLKLSDREAARWQFSEALRLDPANKSAETYLKATLP